MMVHPPVSLVLFPIDYQPPTPPPTTGLHGYQFFVYLQGDRVISIPTKENRNQGEPVCTFAPKLRWILGQN